MVFKQLLPLLEKALVAFGSLDSGSRWAFLEKKNNVRHVEDSGQSQMGFTLLVSLWSTFRQGIHWLSRGITRVVEAPMVVSVDSAWVPIEHIEASLRICVCCSFGMPFGYHHRQLMWGIAKVRPPHVVDPPQTSFMMMEGTTKGKQPF